MIKGKDIHPERSIYYLGAVLIETIKAAADKELNSIALFHKFCEREKVSIEMFTLTLDWLFLLGLVENEKGQIKKCF